MLTNPITAALTTVCLLVPLWSLRTSAPVQDSQATDDPTPEAHPEWGEWSVDERWEGLFGVWQMMELDHSKGIVSPGSVRGFVDFRPGFMTMIIHALRDEQEPDALGQAGLYRWQMTDKGVLQTATMMGHSNFGDEFEWEPPNVPREFRVELDKNDLVLTRPDLSRLIFRRIQPGVFPSSALERIKELRAGLDD
jgi:hypothetical protein